MQYFGEVSHYSKAFLSLQMQARDPKQKKTTLSLLHLIHQLHYYYYFIIILTHASVCSCANNLELISSEYKKKLNYFFFYYYYKYVRTHIYLQRLTNCYLTQPWISAMTVVPFLSIIASISSMTSKYASLLVYLTPVRRHGMFESWPVGKVAPTLKGQHHLVQNQKHLLLAPYSL